MEAINLTKVSIWPKKAGYYKHKNLLSHIKLREKNLMFGDIEIEKKKDFTAIKVLFLKKDVDNEKVSVSNKISYLVNLYT